VEGCSLLCTHCLSLLGAFYNLSLEVFCICILRGSAARLSGEAINSYAGRCCLSRMHVAGLPLSVYLKILTALGIVNTVTWSLDSHGGFSLSTTSYGYYLDYDPTDCRVASRY
jgi:hypothetical protein